MKDGIAMDVCSRNRTDEEWIEELSKISCISLTDEEIHWMSKEIGRLLLALERLEEGEKTEESLLDSAVTEDALRADEVRESLPGETLLKAAAHTEPPYFTVPKTVDDGGAGA